MKKHGWYTLLGFVALLAITVLSLSPRAIQHSVTLTWQAPAPRSGVTVVGYNVYRRTAENDSFIKIAEKVEAPPYEDRQVGSGKKYVYVVTSIDQSGRESRFSTVARAEIPPD